jgi:hypothetical protein
MFTIWSLQLQVMIIICGSIFKLALFGQRLVMREALSRLSRLSKWMAPPSTLDLAVTSIEEVSVFKIGIARTQIH